MPRNIGDSYVMSIGRTYEDFPHASEMSEDIKKSFWERVLEVLADRGVDRDQQTTVAKMIGIKQPSVAEWLDGGKPSMKNAIKLATKLEVCVEWLLTGRGDKRPVPPDSSAQELWRIWQKHPEIREQIASYAAFAASQSPASSPFTKAEPKKPPTPRPTAR